MADENNIEEGGVQQPQGLLDADALYTEVDSRKLHETRWLTAYQNYRGLYGKNIRFRESEKSRVFVKVTKTKVLAAFGQLIDVGNCFSAQNRL